MDITILEQHMNLLKPLLPSTNSPEAAACVLFGSPSIEIDPWAGLPRLRLVSHKVVDIPATDRISASGMHVTWSTRSFMRMLGDAAIAGKVPAIVHTHPGSYAFFSEQDDANERELARTASQKGARGLVSIVLGGDGLQHDYHTNLVRKGDPQGPRGDSDPAEALISDRSRRGRWRPRRAQAASKTAAVSPASAGSRRS